MLKWANFARKLYFDEEDIYNHTYENFKKLNAK